MKPSPPPRWVRRILVTPLALVLLTAVAALTAVLWSLVSVVPRAGRRRRRVAGLLRFAAELSCREVLVVLAMVALTPGRRWIRGWHRIHYRLVLWWLDGPYAVARQELGLRVTTVGELWPQGPLIALCRHAGLGDSLLLVRTLLAAGRRPRIVIQGALQWDPAIDIAGNRLPVVFVPVRPARRRHALPAVEDLARDLEPDEVVVIFPEGGNYSPQRHRSAVSHLVRAGRMRHARQAARLRHLLPPRAAGTHALLRAAPDAPVLLVGHAGLDHLTGLRELWRAVPLGQPVAFRTWEISREQVPVEEHRQTDWLFERWAELDHWVAGVPIHTQSQPKEMSA